MESTDIRIPLLPESELDSIPHKFMDIPYALNSDTQRLDLYLPSSGDAPWPLIVHIHGGAFLFGTRRDCNLRPMLRSLDHGFALASIDYRLSSEARFPALVYDCKAAIRHLRANANAYRIDPNRIAVWGPSAGGYLAAMMAATQGNKAFENPSMGNAGISSDVQAVVDWCGPTGDFCMMDEQIRENGFGIPDHDHALSPESRLLGHAIQEVRELSYLASPIAHVHASMPPVLIHHGEMDGIVPVQQSEQFARRIRDVAGPDRVTLHTYIGKGHHGESWYDNCELTDEIFAFLTKKMPLMLSEKGVT